MSERYRLATLFSRGGTTAEHIIEACRSGKLQMDVAYIGSNNRNAQGVRRIEKKFGIEVDIKNPRDYLNQEDYGEATLKELKNRGVDVIILNGFLIKMPTLVIKEFPEMSFNQHNGPLPDFGGLGMYGMRVPAAVLLYRRLTNTNPWTEVVVQRVDPDNYDAGKAVKAKRVTIQPSDTPETLQERGLREEWKINVELLQDIVDGNVQELKRESFVEPENHKVLSRSKEIAKLHYPRG